MKHILLLSALLLVMACNQDKPNTETDTTMDEAPFFDLSLAQWSLHKHYFAGELDPTDFAQQAKELGFDGVEYVSGLYKPMLEKSEDQTVALQELLEILKANSEQHGVKNLLIMVDEEGDLSSALEADRDAAVEQHKKWVDAAAFLGCHSIRVNLFGAQDQDTWRDASIDGLSKLADYAATKGINILVENHGGFSSNAALLMEVMNAVDKDNCGTLPDFGNFCLRREDGARWEKPCVEEYDMYQGVEEMMPRAIAVSAKSYDFNADGEETKIDYNRMMQIVKDAGYTGYVGVEYEGNDIPPKKGIELTKQLLLSVANDLN